MHGRRSEFILTVRVTNEMAVGPASCAPANGAVLLDDLIASCAVWCVLHTVASCIQARHDEEAAALAKRRANFQRDRDQLAKEAEAEYEDACERAAFKLQVPLWVGIAVCACRIFLRQRGSIPLLPGSCLYCSWQVAQVCMCDDDHVFSFPLPFFSFS